MYPGGEADYDSGLAALRKLASLDVQQDDILSDDGYVPYVWTEFSRNKQVFLKVLYVQLPETTRKGLVQPFRLVCKIKDPTIFSDTLIEASTAPVNFSATTGAASYPIIYPIVFGSSYSEVSIDANNLGDIATYPVAITVHGPVNTPRITNTATGEFIQVNNNLATTDDVLLIAYDKDSLVVTINGNSALSNVSDESIYWKLQPGDNVISLTGSSISDDAYCTVSYYSAWPLS